MRAALVSAFAGLVFGAGLLLSGMARPEKVLAFLDVAGAWDPSLAFVMAGAIGVHLLAYRLVPRLGAPWVGGEFVLPTLRDIDGRLVLGAALFGVGWGLGGYCPGPAVVSLATFGADSFVFFGAMVAGMVAWQAVERRVGRKA